MRYRKEGGLAAVQASLEVQACVFCWWEEGGQGGADNMGDFLKISISAGAEKAFCFFFKEPEAWKSNGRSGPGRSRNLYIEFSTMQSGTKVGVQL